MKIDKRAVDGGYIYTLTNPKTGVAREEFVPLWNGIRAREFERDWHRLIESGGYQVHGEEPAPYRQLRVVRS